MNDQSQVQFLYQKEKKKRSKQDTKNLLQKNREKFNSSK